MKKTVLFICVLFISYACNKQEAGSGETTQESAKSTQGIAITDQAVLDGYFQLKDHLVEGNFQGALESSQELSKAVQAADLDAEAIALAEEISSAEDLSQMRDLFDPFSQALYSWVKSIDKGDVTVYWQYCPMAKDNQGANWLSLESEIMNPYFGDMMLHCGNIEEKF